MATDEAEHGPLTTQDILTGVDGSFSARFTVPWEQLCLHPHALHIAFGDPCTEHELILCAELLPAPPPINYNKAGAKTELRMSLTHSPVRVVSDIDDTVKLSNILSGARAVFHNVFVKELKETVIPGMGPMYSGMYKRGVRFHYVVGIVYFHLKLY